MVAGQHVEEHLIEYHQMIQQQLGHDLPLAVTEFNGGLDTFGSAYRFSFGNALECADLLRVFLKPESHVVFANYFNFLNGYFGMVRIPQRSGRYEPRRRAGLPALRTLGPALWLATGAGGGAIPASGVSRGRKRKCLPGATPPSHAARFSKLTSTQYSSLVGSLWPKLLERPDSTPEFRFYHPPAKPEPQHLSSTGKNSAAGCGPRNSRGIHGQF